MSTETYSNPAAHGAWLLLAARPEDRHYGGNDGYEDSPDSQYSWDETVPNHSKVAVGDRIALWDKRQLIGISVVDAIETGQNEKARYTCPNCGKASIKERRELRPKFRCDKCKETCNEPERRIELVRTYRTHHAPGWVDLEGCLSAQQLRLLCDPPGSQLSIRSLDWNAFIASLGQTIEPGSLTPFLRREATISEGHDFKSVRVRKGQARFRQRLLSQFGAVCAISGSAPEAALEAGHLYSYAEIGKHHDDGGLLLRRDIHALFDRGDVTVDPTTQKVDVRSSLMRFEMYRSLHGTDLHVDLTQNHKKWLRAHWDQHRSDSVGL